MPALPTTRSLQNLPGVEFYTDTLSTIFELTPAPIEVAGYFISGCQMLTFSVLISAQGLGGTGGGDSLLEVDSI
jgi:hypothetical protein